MSGSLCPSQTCSDLAAQELSWVSLWDPNQSCLLCGTTWSGPAVMIQGGCRDTRHFWRHSAFCTGVSCVCEQPSGSRWCPQQAALLSLISVVRSRQFQCPLPPGHLTSHCLCSSCWREKRVLRCLQSSLVTAVSS